MADKRTCDAPLVDYTHPLKRIPGPSWEITDLCEIFGSAPDIEAVKQDRATERMKKHAKGETVQ